MPKLSRLRLVNIGHTDARFDDLILDFRDAAGQAQTSAIWLKNGGGKSTLLSLLFALLLPSRPLLRPKSHLSDYVRPGDRSAIIAEWEVGQSAESATGVLFADEVPQHLLTGVFYQHDGEFTGSQDETSGRDIRKLFFAANAKPGVIGLNLTDLPLYKRTPGKADSRRSMREFRQEWQDLGKQNPDVQAREMEHQREWGEFLQSANIDPELFFYQHRMNREEGGADALFDLPNTDAFTDLFIEMLMSEEEVNQIMQSIRAQAHNIKNRNSWEKERELVEELSALMIPLVRLKQERFSWMQDLKETQIKDEYLKDFLNIRISEIKVQYQELLKNASDASDQEHEYLKLALMKELEAAYLYKRGSQLKAEQKRAQASAVQKDKQDAQRKITLLNGVVALRILRRVETKIADYVQKQNEIVDEVSGAKEALWWQVQTTANEYAAALLRRHDRLRQQQGDGKQKAQDLKDAAQKARIVAQQQVDEATKLQNHADQLNNQIHHQTQDCIRLTQIGVCKSGETPHQVHNRLQNEIAVHKASFEQWQICAKEYTQQIKMQLDVLMQLSKDRAMAAATAAQIQAVLNEIKTIEHDFLKEMMQEKLLKFNLWTQEDLASLNISFLNQQLQSCIRQGLNEVTRELTLLEESESRVAHLRVEKLLPPEKDIVTVIELLRHNGLTVWSGWYLIATNVGDANRRSFVEQCPELARSVVVDNKDWEHAVVCMEQNLLVLKMPVLLCSLDTFQTSADEVTLSTPSLYRRVFGPSDAAQFSISDGTDNLIAEEEVCENRQSIFDTAYADIEAVLQAKTRLKHFLQRDQETGGQKRRESQVSETEAHSIAEERKYTQTVQDLHETINTQAEERHRTVAHITAWLQAVCHLTRVLEHLERFGNLDANMTRQRCDELREQAHRLHVQAQDNEAEASKYDEMSDALAQAVQKYGEDIAVIQDRLADVIRRGQIDRDSLVATSGDTEALHYSFELAWENHSRQINQDAWSVRLQEVRNQEKERSQEYDRWFSKQSSPPISTEEVERALYSLADPSDAEEHAIVATEQHNLLSAKCGCLLAEEKQANTDLQGCEKKYREAQVNALKEKISVSEEWDEKGAAEDLEKRARSAEGLAEIARNQIEACKAIIAHAQNAKILVIKRLSNVENLYQRQEKIVEEVQEDLLKEKAINENAIDTESEVVLPRSWQPPFLDEDIETCINDREAKRKKERDSKEQIDEKREDIVNHIRTSIYVPDFVSLLDENSNYISTLLNPFRTMKAETFELNAELNMERLKLRAEQLTQALEEIEPQHRVIVNQVLQIAQTALKRLESLQRRSALPELRPFLGNKPFLSVQIKQPIGAEFREAETRIDTFLRELAHSKDPLPSGMVVIQRAVRRLATSIQIRALFPDDSAFSQEVVTPKSIYSPLEKTRSWSGGERLTFAVLLFCTLASFRANQAGKQFKSSGVLVLDNPVGKSSNARFLTMQQGLARVFGIQLIYTTAVDDHEALQTFGHLVRLRSDRRDRHTGQKLVETQVMHTATLSDKNSDDKLLTASHLTLPVRSDNLY